MGFRASYHALSMSASNLSRSFSVVHPAGKFLSRPTVIRASFIPLFALSVQSQLNFHRHHGGDSIRRLKSFASPRWCVLQWPTFVFRSEHANFFPSFIARRSGVAKSIAHHRPRPFLKGGGRGFITCFTCQGVPSGSPYLFGVCFHRVGISGVRFRNR